MTPAGNFSEAILVENGKWALKSAAGAVVRSTVNADEQWHHIVLSHYTARGETLFFVDGKLAGRVSERLEPRRFVLGGPDSAGNPAAPPQSDYKDLLVYRSALNADEAAALASNTLLQASLEVFAPLSDTAFAPESALENRAQSLSVLKVGEGRIAHAAR
ncbi:MAG: hypothetical protein DMF60_16000 [Acidobacteria bacterium]|nr:MAG: hypothetical protein DMF60_16000 [Acidobacteriota bacterium]